MKVENMVEPRNLMMLDFITKMTQCHRRLFAKSDQVPYYAGTYKMFKEDESYRNELCMSICKEISEEIGQITEDYIMDEKQVAIELGYFFRHSPVFDTANRKTQYNALCLGTFEAWFAEMCVSKLGHYLKDANWKNTPEKIYENYFENGLPSLRSIISIGEQLTPFMGADLFHILGVGKAAVAEHIQKDDTITNADWYWESVVEEMFNDVATQGTASFDESDGVSKTTPTEYFDEWMWDIIATRFGWGSLSWEELGNWGCNNTTFQVILERMVIYRAGQFIKEDYFPSEETVEDWRRDNQ